MQTYAITARRVAGRSFGQSFDRAARGYIDGRCADFEARIRQHIGRSVSEFEAEVGEQHMLARAHPPSNGLADRPSADNNITLVISAPPRQGNRRR